MTGLRGLYGYSMSRVPVMEMTTLLSLTVTKRPLKMGQWIRLKRGALKVRNTSLFVFLMHFLCVIIYLFLPHSLPISIFLSLSLYLFLSFSLFLSLSLSLSLPLFFFCFSLLLSLYPSLSLPFSV